jgi:hypothetical protein
LGATVLCNLRSDHLLRKVMINAAAAWDLG